MPRGDFRANNHCELLLFDAGCIGSPIERLVGPDPRHEARQRRSAEKNAQLELFPELVKRQR